MTRSTMRHAAFLWSFILAFGGAAAFAAEYRVEKRLPLAPGGLLHLSSEEGSVEIRGAATQEVVLVVTSDRADFASIFDLTSESPRADRVEFKLERKTSALLRWFEGNRHTRLVLTVPDSANLEVQTSGGGIEIAGVRGKVNAESSGGGVRAHEIGGPSELSSSGGAIDASAVSGDLVAESSGGGIEIREAHGRVVASSSGGAVSVDFADGNAKGGDLSSSGGGVEATVDPAVGLEIDASSSGGAVSCDLPLTTRGKVDRDDARGALNGGGALLKLRSSGGGIGISAH